METYKFASQLCGSFGATVAQPANGSCGNKTAVAGSKPAMKTKVAAMDFSV